MSLVINPVDSRAFQPRYIPSFDSTQLDFTHTRSNQFLTYDANERRHESHRNTVPTGSQIGSPSRTPTSGTQIPRGVRLRRTGHVNNEDDQSDSEDEFSGNPYQRIARCNNRRRPAFACPYAKACDMKCSHQSTCSSLQIRSIVRIKQHLGRIHIESQHSSLEPSLGLTSQTSFSTDCSDCLIKRMTWKQKQMVDAIVRYRANRTREVQINKWYQIYEVLFPGIDTPLSPFAISNEHLSPAINLAVERVRYRFQSLKFTVRRELITNTAFDCVSQEEAAGVDQNSVRTPAHSKRSAKGKDSRKSRRCAKQTTSIKKKSESSPREAIEHAVQQLLHEWAVRKMEASLRLRETASHAANSSAGQKQQNHACNDTNGNPKDQKVKTKSGNGQRGHKRKRSVDSDGDDGNEETPSPMDPDRPPDANDQGSRLYCPFHWHDPETFSDLNMFEEEYNSCGIVKLENITRLKQHLWRVHKMPLFFCDRCFLVFKDRPSLTRHNRQTNPCRVVEPERYTRKLTDEQVDIIKQRITAGTTTEKWNFIYTTIFPDGIPPDSPYYDGVPLFLRRKLPNVLAKILATLGINLTKEQFDGCVAIATSELRQKLDSRDGDQDEIVASGSTSLISALTGAPPDTTTASQRTRDVRDHPRVGTEHVAEEVAQQAPGLSPSQQSQSSMPSWTVDNDEDFDWDQDWSRFLAFDSHAASHSLDSTPRSNPRPSASWTQHDLAMLQPMSSRGEIVQ